MSDLVAACEAGASSHGEAVGCVALRTSDLKQQGIISGEQKGRIQRCAAAVVDP